MENSTVEAEACAQAGFLGVLGLVTILAREGSVTVQDAEILSRHMLIAFNETDQQGRPLLLAEAAANYETQIEDMVSQIRAIHSRKRDGREPSGAPREFIMAAPF